MAGRFIISEAPIACRLQATPQLTLFPILNFLTAFPGASGLPCPRTSWHESVQLTLGKANEILVHAVV